MVNPFETEGIHELIQKMIKEGKMPANPKYLSPPQQQWVQTPHTTPQPHALDPNVQQILQLEGALVAIAHNNIEENI